MIEYRRRILLLGIKSFNGERSISGLYHLLKGKKSSQTIQDGKLFHISYLFRTMPRLTRWQFDDDISFLLTNGYLIRLERQEDHLFVTAKGKAELDLFEKDVTFPKGLNGWEYEQLARIFWGRFSLLTQTVSNVLEQHASFIPVIRDERIIRWLKGWLAALELSKSELGQALYEEAYQLIGTLPPLQAKVITLRLSAFHRYGLTFAQIGVIIEEDEDAALFLLQAALHHIIQQLKASPERYPLLSSIIKDVHTDVPLTQSTRKTYDLWKQGLTVEDIVRIRRLKLSTIEDHFVEITLNDPAFSIQPFVSKQLQTEIRQIHHQLRTRRMKSIKEAMQSDASYFQIRLVLAKGELSWD